MTAQMDTFLAAMAEEIAAKVTQNLLAEMPAPDRLLSVKEAGEILGVSERTVRGLKAEGKLAFIQVGQGQGGVRFERAEIERYKDSRRVARR